MTAAEHLTRTTNDRGFTHLPAIPSGYGGGIRAFESSAASGPHVWLQAIAPANLNEPDGPRVEVPLHLTAQDAWHLAEQLMTLVAGHYQGDARPAERVADLREFGPRPEEAG